MDPHSSRRPVSFQSSEHFRRPEPDGPAQLEGRDDAGNPPLVELTAADLEEGGEFGFGEEFKFVARRGLVRVHARRERVNLSGPDGDRDAPGAGNGGAEFPCLLLRVVTNGDRCSPRLPNWKSVGPT